MPIGELFSSIAQPIGTGFGQPYDISHRFRGKRYTIWHMLPPPRIIGAAGALLVEHFAADIAEIDASRILIFRLMQAAFATAVAQSLPLFPAKLRQRQLPEARAQGHRLFHPALQRCGH